MQIRQNQALRARIRAKEAIELIDRGSRYLMSRQFNRVHAAATCCQDYLQKVGGTDLSSQQTGLGNGGSGVTECNGDHSNGGSTVSGRAALQDGLICGEFTSGSAPGQEEGDDPGWAHMRGSTVARGAPMALSSGTYLVETYCATVHLRIQYYTISQTSSFGFAASEYFDKRSGFPRTDQ